MTSLYLYLFLLDLTPLKVFLRFSKLGNFPFFIESSYISANSATGEPVILDVKMLAFLKLSQHIYENSE